MVQKKKGQASGSFRVTAQVGETAGPSGHLVTARLPSPSSAQPARGVADRCCCHMEDGWMEALWLELCRLSTKVDELLFLLTLVSPGRLDFRCPAEQQKQRCRSSWKRWPVKSR